MEEGIEREDIKILSNPNDIQQLYLNRLQSALSEISLILSSHNALERQYKIGLTDMLKKAAKEKNVRINLAIPDMKDKNKVALNLQIILKTR